jgi:hypothetical protein
MLGHRALAAAAVAACLAVAAPAGAAVDAVTVQVDRTNVATRLGEKFTFTSTITNTSPSPSPPLIAHLNVLSLRNGVYVDPEDWSSQRTWYLGTLAAGASRTITWRVQAVNTGSFATYVAVLAQDAPTAAPVTGPAVELRVAGRRTINSDGILPLALGVPILLGLLTAGARLRRRRG